MSADSPRSLVLRSRVPASANGSPLLDYLARRFPYHTTEHWRGEVQAGRIRLRGGPARAEDRVATGDEVEYRRAHDEPWVDDRVTIVHRDEALLVVDKPAHLPMHADGPFVASTLIHVLRTRCGEPGLSLVHRLDRETSGVCVVPRTTAARTALHAQFDAGTVQKTYLAVVHGHLATGLVLDAPIGLAPGSQVALRRLAGPAALQPRAARTEVEVVAHGPAATLVRCRPRTGRTHQIRAHLEAAGHPLVGDRLYGRPDEDYLAFVRAVKRTGDPRGLATNGPDRQLLHAESLSFLHPSTGAPSTFCTAEPSEFRRWLEQTAPRTPPAD